MSKPRVERVENQEELVTLWHESKECSTKAREALSEAKQIARDAEDHWNKCVVLERAAWQAVQQSEWVEGYSRMTGELIYRQRSQIANLDLG